MFRSTQTLLHIICVSALFTACGESPKTENFVSAPEERRNSNGKIPILVSSFEPMNGRPQNNSEFIAELLPEYLQSFHVIPCPSLRARYDDAAAELIACFEANSHVAAVVSLGESKDSIEIEQYATNLDHSPEIDNSGEVRRQAPIIAGAPDFLPLTLSGDSLFRRSKPKRSPVQLKYNNFKRGMGNFISNNLAFRFAHHLRTTGRSTPFGFIHVPHAMSPSQRHSPYEVANALGHLFEKGLRPLLRTASEI